MLEETAVPYYTSKVHFDTSEDYCEPKTNMKNLVFDFGPIIPASDICGENYNSYPQGLNTKCRRNV